MDEKRDGPIEPSDPAEGVRIIGAEDAEKKDKEEEPGRGADDVSMPHWTEPGTGEVPRIFAPGGEDQGGDEEDNAWSSFTTSQPRWRGDDTGQDIEEFDDLSTLADDESRVGALDPSRPDPGFFTFDDLSGDPRRPAGAAPPSEGAGPEEEPEPVFSPPSARPITSDPRRTTTRGRPGPATPYERPAPGPRDMQTAIVVGVVFAAVALLLFYLGPKFTMFLVTAVILLAAAEFFNALRRAGHQPATLLGIVASVGMVLGAYWRGPAAIPLLLFLTVVFTLLWYWWAAGGERAVGGVSTTLFGVCYVGVLGSFAALLLQLPDGVGLLLGAVVPAVFYDVGGLVVGRAFGRSPLTAISPNKTWEGLAGGVILTVLSAVIILGLFPGVHPWDDFYVSFRLGVAIAIAAPLGDLAESLIKRDLGVKDMGELLPGHGGLLDRFDAMLFALPTAYYVALLIL
jgi:phosphatidate cytidylyltransferase